MFPSTNKAALQIAYTMTRKRKGREEHPVLQNDYIFILNFRRNSIVNFGLSVLNNGGKINLLC
jgi:hypothetical protein